jgi:hypothetical protein
MDKYKIELRHRAQSNEPYEEKHKKFMEAISRLGRPWNLVGLEALPDIGSELLVTVSLDKVLGAGIKGRLTYMYRSEEYLEDNAQYDDNLFIEFNSGKIDLEDVVNVLPVYISSFGCYRATVHNWGITRSDWPKIVEECNSTGKDVNGRDGVYRINAINYFDRELCKRAFSLSPEEIVKRLTGKVESVSLLGDGVFLIYSSQPLKREEHEKIDREIKTLLV